MAVRIKVRLRLVVVGSPVYFQAHAMPNEPAGLKGHVCIRTLFPSGAHCPWEFEKNGQTFAQRPHVPLSLDDRALIAPAAPSDAALAYV